MSNFKITPLMIQAFKEGFHGSILPDIQVESGLKEFLNHLIEDYYLIPKEISDDDWDEIEYNVNRKADPDIPLWRQESVLTYADFIAGVGKI